MNDSLKTAEVVNTEQGQAIVLPDEFRFSGDRVAVRQSGEAIILEPIKPAQWPAGFFERIRIDDPAFIRPDQGPVPPAPSL